MGSKSRLKWVLCAVAVWAVSVVFYACNAQTAGTSSGTENPEIVLAFSENNKSTLVNGDLLLYASSQNTVVNPEPLARFSVANDSELVLSLDSMGRLVEDSELFADASQQHPLLNFIFRESGRGGFAGGLHFIREEVQIEKNGKKLEILNISLNIKKFISGELVLNQKNEDPIYMYIPGTDVKSEVEHNNFEMDGLVGLDSTRIMMRSGRIFKAIKPKITGDSLIVDTMDYEDSVDVKELGFAPTVTGFSVQQDSVFASVALSSPCELVDYPKYLLDYDPEGRERWSGDKIDSGLVSWDAILWRIGIRGNDFYLDFSTTDILAPALRVYYEFVPPQPNCRPTGKPDDVLMDSAIVIHPVTFERLGKISFTGVEIDTLITRFYPETDPVNSSGFIASPPSRWPPPFASYMETWDWVEGDSIRSDTLFFPGKFTADFLRVQNH